MIDIDYPIYSRSEELPLFIPGNVCVIGVGGVGSWVAINMAMIGCSNLAIIDPDTIEVHNLNRTLFKQDHVGANKVNALYEVIREMRNTTMFVHACKWEELPPETRTNYAANFMVIDCRDTVAPLPETPRTLVTGGYDGTSCTIHYNPDFSNVFGDTDVRYRITPSYLVIPQFIAACITNFICLECNPENNMVREMRKERFMTFDFKNLSRLIEYGNAALEQEDRLAA